MILYPNKYVGYLFKAISLNNNSEYDASIKLLEKSLKLNKLPIIHS